MVVRRSPCGPRHLIFALRVQNTLPLGELLHDKKLCLLLSLLAVLVTVDERVKDDG